MLQTLFKNALNSLLPPTCLVCAEPCAGTSICFRCLPPKPQLDAETRCLKCHSPLLHLAPKHLCPACRTLPPPFRQIRYLWNYEGRIQNLIKTIKYKPSPRLCRIIAGTLTQYFPALFELADWDFIVPIPSSIQSVRQRGFNQCALIAKELARFLSSTFSSAAKCDLHGLTHQGYRQPQAALDHEFRLNNVKKAFRVKDKRFADKRILLVDDVVTTGATSSAAALTLAKAGAQSIDLISLCRAAAWHEFRQAVHLAFPVDKS